MLRPEKERRVLVVEDNDELRTLLTVILEARGYRVSSASNGREALELLRQDCEFSVILLDLCMPVMDGKEFRAEQRKDPVLAAIPVVLLSATHDVVREAEALKASGWFQKPPPLSELFNLLDSFCVAIFQAGGAQPA